MKVIGLPLDRQLHYLNAFFDNISKEMIPEIVAETMGVPLEMVTELNLVAPEGSPMFRHRTDRLTHGPEFN